MNNWRQDAARTRRQDACATLVAAGAVQSLGNEGPSSFVRLCQTIFYKKIMKLRAENGGWKNCEFRCFPEISGDFLKNMKTAPDFRYAIDDLRKAGRRGNQTDGRASKCLRCRVRAGLAYRVASVPLGAGLRRDRARPCPPAAGQTKSNRGKPSAQSRKQVPGFWRGAIPAYSHVALGQFPDLPTCFRLFPAIPAFWEKGPESGV